MTSVDLTRDASSLSLVDALSPFEISVFRDYLRLLLPLLLGADQHELSLLLDTLSFEEMAKKWASDSQAGVIYILKSRDQQLITDSGERHHSHTPF